MTKIAEIGPCHRCGAKTLLRRHEYAWLCEECHPHSWLNKGRPREKAGVSPLPVLLFLGAALLAYWAVVNVGFWALCQLIE